MAEAKFAFPIDAKHEFAKGKCAACGKPVALKVNMRGLVYYFCPHVDEKANYCAHHQKWGRYHSTEILRKHFADKVPEPVQPSNVNAAPAKGGFGFDF